MKRSGLLPKNPLLNASPPAMVVRCLPLVAFATPEFSVSDLTFERSI